MRTALVFPGQGSFRPGTLEAWARHPAIGVLDEIEAGTGRDAATLDADATTGSRTADAQPAILAASLVAWRAVSDAGIEADALAGHSLGELCAAVAAGAIEVGEGAALVAERGRAMGEACAADPGTMIAVVKLSPDAVDVLVEEIDGLVLANDNAPGQVVLAGPPDAIATARERARDAGGRALSLEVEGAFHSPAMAPAVAAIRAQLAATTVAAPGVPIVSGVTAASVTDAVRVREVVADGILAPVRWREVQLRLAALGITDVIELGPGGVLAGLAKRTVPELRVHRVAGPDDLAAVTETLAPVGARS